MLLLGPPESVVDVVGDFGEAAQRGDVRVLFELLRGPEKTLDLILRDSRRGNGWGVATVTPMDRATLT